MVLARLADHSPEAKAEIVPAAIEEEPPSEWVFWPSGNCEPAVVTYKGPLGAWKANYSPLSGRPDLEYYAAK